MPAVRVFSELERSLERVRRKVLDKITDMKVDVKMFNIGLEECELMNDSRYKSYVNQVEKALKSFEYTSEWADLISALGKLNKVLSTHIKYPVIPKRVIIGKRLAQCLHPALPSGVHLKVLETYDIIFKCIGTSRLASDLFTYSAGLFPLLGYAAMNVRGPLLQLYETHFVSLARHIKPALTGLISALLPGLEEGSEHFDRTSGLLEDFCEAVDPSFFYGALWECVVASSANRLSAINFVLAHFNKKQSMEDQLHFIGTNMDRLVSALCCSVEDSNILVQRSALDLLLAGFRIHNSQLTRDDMIHITSSSIRVVLRRDMSLNRRLYAWLLGTDSNGLPLPGLPGSGVSQTAGSGLADLERQDSTVTNQDVGMDYFNVYSKDLLVAAIKQSLRGEDGQDSIVSRDQGGRLGGVNLRPFRVLMSLLDKPEVGQAVLEDILLEIFRCMYRECSVTSQSRGGAKLMSQSLFGSQSLDGKLGQKVADERSGINSEIVKTANLLFGAFEPFFIWQFIGRTFESACQQVEETRGDGVGLGKDAGKEIPAGSLNRSSSVVSEGVRERVTVEELCNLVEFLLDKLTVEAYRETQTMHLPVLLHSLMTSLTLHLPSLSDHHVTVSLSLCSKILSRVQPAVTPTTTPQHRPHPHTTITPQASTSIGSALAAAVSLTTAVSKVAAECSHPIGSEETVGGASGATEPVIGSGDAEGSASSATQAVIGPEVAGGVASVVNGAVIGGEGAVGGESDVFCDFVQFSDKEIRAVQSARGKTTDKAGPGVVTNTDSDTVKQTNSTRGSVSHVSNILRDCIVCYLRLYETFTRLRIVTDRTDLQSFLTSKDFLRFPSSTDESLKPEAQQDDAPRVTKETCIAYEQSCRLLVEFSSLPLQTSDTRSVEVLNHLNLDNTASNSHSLPRWLELLVACACGRGFSMTPESCLTFTLVSAAVSAVLDLISLTQSIVEQSSRDQSEGFDVRRRRSLTDGVTVSVNILSIMSEKELEFLNNSTNFYKICAVLLWSYLSESYADCHVKATELLYQLQQLSPQPSTCEDVISSSLLSNNKEERFQAHCKFSVLWHLMRDHVTQSVSLPRTLSVRTFDRSLLLMLDSLTSDDTHICSALSQTWLLHCIQRGDVVRVLEPVLLILLHPDTARVSIQHVSIHTPRRIRVRNDSTDSVATCDSGSTHGGSGNFSVSGSSVVEASIYAISSEGGHVIYHVATDRGGPAGGPGPQTKKSSRKVEEELQTLLVKDMEGALSKVTRDGNIGETLCCDRIDPRDLSLHVNPFLSGGEGGEIVPPPSTSLLPHESMTSRDESSTNTLSDVQRILKAKRLTSETCRREKIFFDDEMDGLFDSEENQEQETGSSEDVKKLMEDIIDALLESVVPSDEVVLSEERVGEGEDGVGAETELVVGGENGAVVESIIPPDESGSEEASKKSRRDEVDNGRGQTEATLIYKETTPIHSDGQGEKPEATPLHNGHLEDSNTDQIVENGKVLNEDDTQLDVYTEALEQGTWSQVDGPLEQSTWSHGPDSAMVDSTALQASVETEGTHFPTSAPVPVMHPLHTHIMLYTRKYDTARTLYALRCIKSVLSTSARTVVCALTTSNLGGSATPHIQTLLELLVRHRRSVFGKNFHSEVGGAGGEGGMRSSMFVEVLVSVCLYYVRSYYPNLMMSKLNKEELTANKDIQILSCDILNMVLTELINIVRSSGRGFATYIGELLVKCKVQKAVLYLVVSSVYNSRQGLRTTTTTSDSQSLTEAIISFNDGASEPSNTPHNDSNDTLQIRLLKLLLTVIVLEDQVCRSTGDPSQVTASLPNEWDNINVSSLLVNNTGGSVVDYLSGRPAVYQPMLLAAVVGALKQQHQCRMHRHWMSLVISSTPYLHRAVTRVTVSTVGQLCRNVELLSQLYEKGQVSNSVSSQPERIPADHLVTLLEGLTEICHHCLLDSGSSAGVSGGSGQQSTDLLSHTAHSLPDCVPGARIDLMSLDSLDPGSAASGLLNNIAQSFSSGSRETTPGREMGVGLSGVRQETRSHMLNILPRVLSSLTVLWRALKHSEGQQQQQHELHTTWWSLGSPKAVRQCILEFVSPLALHHTQHVLAAVACVWNERRYKTAASNKRVIPLAGTDQLLLVDLVYAVKLLPIDTIIQTVKQIIKQPPQPGVSSNNNNPAPDSKQQAAGLSNASQRGVGGVPLEVGLLRFLYSYIQRVDTHCLTDTWPTLLSLLKDGLQINLLPPGQFSLLAILSEYLSKVPMLEERKDLKDLQEITQRLLEATSEVAGASLEQTTFFRRNLAVIPGPQAELGSLGEGLEEDEEEGSNDVSVGDVVDQPTNSTSTSTSAANARLSSSMSSVATALVSSATDTRQYSVQALVLLADVTATLLDIVYRSEEKEQRVAPLLSNILYNVFPYLKNHSLNNHPSFRAGSQLLASLSSYQYTRRAWKREAFDLLIDGGFFEMEEDCVRSWMITIDNLMSHDRTTFKDLLTRVNVTQGTSLNLFSSKEAECEQRAQLLKRLSFVILCSEIDQYQKFMPDIQEKLAECLRQPLMLSLQAQVFLCFRVLLLRMSPQYLTSLWPTIITELVHVMLQIEQELITEEKPSNKKTQLSKLDASTWQKSLSLASTNNNGSSASKQPAAVPPAWLQLYLQACKLLDLALCLPADVIPQFQLYRWAFVGEGGTEMNPMDVGDRRRLGREMPPSFVPHCIKIARLMHSKLGEIPLLAHSSEGLSCGGLHTPLLTSPRVGTLLDLCGFFATISFIIEHGGTPEDQALNLGAPLHNGPATKSSTKTSGMYRSISAPDVCGLKPLLGNDSSPMDTKSMLSSSPLADLPLVEQIVIRDMLDALPSK